MLYFLKDNRAKAFVLDIETDSTIMVDEQKPRSSSAASLSECWRSCCRSCRHMIAAEPAAAKFCGEVLKFATAPFRAGRSLDGAIDELVELMESKAEQPRGDDPTTCRRRPRRKSSR